MKKNLLLITAIVLFKTLSAQVWTNGQSASYALGAASPSVSGSISASANTFGPTVVNICFAIDAKHGCLYVADFFSHRVLRFAYPVTSNQPSANLVFGQSNFTSTGSSLTQNGFMYPQGLAVDSTSGTLWVLSQGQNRILRFDGAHTITVNNPNANAVIGQPNFVTGSAATTAAGLSFNVAPQCANQLYYDQITGALWVADNGNIRVLRYDNAATLPDGPAANAVLGQAAFNTNNATISQSTFNRPDGITMIGSSLFVSDPPNNRVLRFDNANSLPNGSPANAVYGQLNFFSNTVATSATGLYEPTGLASDQNHLYVSELGNQRILIYNNPLTNTTANNVLLAPNLTTAGSAAATPSTGGANTGIAYDAKYGQLIVQDRSNNRALVFTSCGGNFNISGPSSVCNGSSVVLTGSGATSYLWNTAATTTSISVSPSVTTAYSFTGTATSCTTAVTKTIVVNPLPTVSVSSSASLICTGSSVSITLSGASTYTWTTPASTNTTIVVSPAATTIYTVTGTDGNGCVNTATFTQNVSLCTGLNQSGLAKQNSLSVFPNPNAGNFTIHLTTSSEIMIYNLLGEVIVKDQLSEGAHNINISNVANGIYFVKAIENGRSQIIKIVKQ